MFTILCPLIFWIDADYALLCIIMHTAYFFYSMHHLVQVMPAQTLPMKTFEEIDP